MTIFIEKFYMFWCDVKSRHTTKELIFIFVVLRWESTEMFKWNRLYL